MSDSGWEKTRWGVGMYKLYKERADTKKHIHTTIHILTFYYSVFEQ